MTQQLENVNIASQELLITPEQLKTEIPLSEAAIKTVSEGRQTINNILDRKDHRLFIVVGPCSIHDIKAAKEYAQKLKTLADEVSDTLYIVMRVYFEKPRTTVGWKGLINDPHLDDSFDIQQGLHIGRQLLIDIAELGLPAATEALDPISPQYLQDTISWSAIGARTTESQTHREMSSGLSVAIGFKNGTDGGLSVAMNGAPYLTAPNVRPRTSCFWLIQPNTRIGATARLDAADSFAQKSPSGAEKEAMKAVSGAAFAAVRFSVQNASFQARMMFSSTVDAMPGIAIGVRT